MAFIPLYISHLEIAPSRLIIKVNSQSNYDLQKELGGKWGDEVWLETLSNFGNPLVEKILTNYSVKEIRKLIVGKIIDHDRKPRLFGLDRYYLIVFKDQIKLKDVIKKLKETKFSEVVKPEGMRSVGRILNDPMYGVDYWTKSWFLPKIEAPYARNISTDSPSVVGPIDTGVEWTHGDIFANLWVDPGEDLNHNGIFDYPLDLNGVDDGDGAVNVISVDIVDSTNGTLPGFYYTSPIESGNFGYVWEFYEGGYKSLYFSLPFEVTGTVDNARLFEEILMFFILNTNINSERYFDWPKIKVLQNMVSDRVKFLGSISKNSLVRIYNVTRILRMKRNCGTNRDLEIGKLNDRLYFKEIEDRDRKDIVFKGKNLKIQGGDKVWKY